MMKFILILVGALFLMPMLGLIVQAGSDSSRSKVKSAPAMAVSGGVVLQIDSEKGVVILKDLQGTFNSTFGQDGNEFPISSSTVITKFGQKIALADILPGDKVEIAHQRQDQKTVVIKIKVRAPLFFQGKIEKIDAQSQTITVKSEDRSEIFKVDPSLVITRNRKPATVNDLQEDDEILVGHGGDQESPRALEISARAIKK